MYPLSGSEVVILAYFLNALEERMPFWAKTIQVNGGPEFEAAFEEKCQKRNIRLFVLPPNSPGLNGYVERAYLTHTEEFCEGTDSSFNVAELKDKLLDWEKVISSSPIFGLPHPSGVP